MKGSIIRFLRDYWVLLLITIAGIGLAVLFIQPVISFYDLLMDRQVVIAYLEDWGAAAPAVFVLIQILQVVFAPVPGEFSGIVGGYLFGSLAGFVYSSIGLTIGSVINFGIGRFLGKRVVRKLIPAHHLARMEHFLVHQGLLLILALFVLPGFPKDYLSLFLGVSGISFRIFLPVAALGRMPGTLMLSVQGAFWFERNYKFMAGVLLASVFLLLLAFRFRDCLYKWAERQEYR
jgi:uncharacterized membrane protein YdjX (TVP38/TMEM64 family)